MSLGLLFAGQGTQHADMLRWVDACPQAAPTLAALAGVLGADWREQLRDPAWAQRNDIAQPLLTGLGVAAWQCLAPQLPAPIAVAGYSVGELAAFCAAGVFDVTTALTLATQRAALMDACVAGQDTGLLSVRGISLQALAALCAIHHLAIAIRLGDDRAVLGGTTLSLAQAETQLLALGAHCTTLAVRIASHTGWVAPAAAAFEQRLAGVPIGVPQAALICNHSGHVERRPHDLRRALARQIESTVLWDSCMDTMAERGVRCVLELGPGRPLAQLWSERHPGVPVRSVDEFRSPQAICQWVTTMLR
jgi:[acyl-carrier-protein] S-malonyltransferase